MMLAVLAITASACGFGDPPDRSRRSRGQVETHRNTDKAKTDKAASKKTDERAEKATAEHPTVGGMPIYDSLWGPKSHLVREQFTDFFADQALVMHGALGNIKASNPQAHFAALEQELNPSDNWPLIGVPEDWDGYIFLDYEQYKIHQDQEPDWFIDRYAQTIERVKELRPHAKVGPWVLRVWARDPATVEKMKPILDAADAVGTAIYLPWRIADQADPPYVRTESFAKPRLIEPLENIHQASDKPQVAYVTPHIHGWNDRFGFDPLTQREAALLLDVAASASADVRGIGVWEALGDGEGYRGTDEHLQYVIQGIGAFQNTTGRAESSDPPPESSTRNAESSDDAESKKQSSAEPSNKVERKVIATPDGSVIRKRARRRSRDSSPN